MIWNSTDRFTTVLSRSSMKTFDGAAVNPGTVSFYKRYLPAVALSYSTIAKDLSVICGRIRAESLDICD
jgi:hypothetical protein